jgi:hypothetical protein
MTIAFPRMLRVRQNFPVSPPLDIRATVNAEFHKLRARIKPGAHIAVGVGSRGITNLPAIVLAVLENLRAAGAKPFIIPAMGSHGGATPDGQTTILADYGITEAAMDVPIRASMETRRIGETVDGLPVFCSTEVLAADGVFLINRIKPHTDFSGALGSGLMKMAVVGLGKRDGATALHVAASRQGHEAVIRKMGRVMISTAPLLGGLAILENQFHETAKLIVLPREEMESGEDALFVEAKKLMPSLPFEEIDLLIVDRIGKNISGSGMDPNVTGRWVNGYSSSLARENRPMPFIRRIFVRDLTPETHGNAIGIGLADVTTTRLVRAMDSRATYINALTALTPNCAKVPIHFDTDREAVEMLLRSLALPDLSTAKIVRIADTLSLAELEASESLLPEIRQRPNLAALSQPGDMRFDDAGDLA